MKKVLLLSTLTAFLTLGLFAQTVIYEDDFESYNVGEYLAEQSGEWTTWSGAPGTAEDAFISDEQAASPTKSVKVDGTTDLVKPLGDKTSGKYEVSMWVYIPSGYNGYYNIQHYEQPGVEWALEVFFEEPGNGYINAGGNDAATFVFNHDSWFEVRNIIDLNNDTAELYVDGAWVHGWQFSLQADGSAGALQLGGMNCYAWAPSGGDPLYYFDDYLYQMLPDVLFEDDFESYNVGEYLCEQSGWWDTWSHTPGTAEDAFISDEQAQSGTQSLKIEGTSDIIGPFGNKISGSYQISFSYYVPTGYGGYYNIQHWEDPGVEWAYEVYFGELGEGYLTVGGNNTYFNFDHDTWFLMENMIDIDNDLAAVYIDGQLILEFQFSQQANSGDPGTNQLGGIDIYAGAPQGETPLFYVDDFKWTQVNASNDPQIAVSPSSFLKMVNAGNMEEDVLTIENVGAADLEYDVDIMYNIDADFKTASSAAVVKNGKKQLENIVLEYNSEKPVNVNPSPTDDVVLHYDGEPNGGIGHTAAIQWEVAAKFINEDILQYAGMELYMVEVFIYNQATAFQLRVYGEGDAPFNTGTQYVAQNFVAIDGNWNEITLQEPVLLTGEDLWVGYWIDEQVADEFPPGTDAGPADPNGDWTKSGVAWTHLSSNPDLNYNWNIRAHLQGEPIIQWLSVAPESGTIVPGELDELTVEFDASELTLGQYSATIQINSNDVVHPIVDVPCTMAVLVGVNEVGENNAVLTYPNPTSNVMNIRANHNITNVRVMNYVGQLIADLDCNSETVAINVSDFESGIYILQITTVNGQTTQQIVVE